MPHPKIKFSDEEARELREDHRLTEPQFRWLQRDLGFIADLAGPGVPMQDVRDELTQMAKHLANARALVEKWERASLPAAGAEAIGHLGIASVGLVSLPPGASDERLAVVSAIYSLAATADKAVANARNKRQPRATAPQAVARIYECVCRPSDDLSTQSAIALRPSRYDGKDGPRFARVAQLVFDAIARASSKATGSVVQPLSAGNSIREYLRIKKLHKPDTSH